MEHREGSFESRGISAAIIDRYCAGIASPDDLMTLETWWRGRPERQEQVERLRAALRIREAPISSTAERRHVAATIASAVPSEEVVTVRRARTLARIAAVVLLAIGATLVWRAMDRTPAGTAPAATAMRTYETPRGQYATVVLTDGTRIVLGPASRLRAAVDGESPTRLVYLDAGQALFEVRHDAQRPFHVHAGNAVATDLGTTFVVRAYDRVDVAVMEGVVALAPAAATRTDSVVLGRGDLGHVTPAGELEAKRGVPLERYTAWAEGRLVFHNTPLGEAVAELSRWYDLDIQLADSALAHRRVTGSFRNEPVTQVLHLIALSVGLRQEQQGRAVTFRY